MTRARFFWLTLCFLYAAVPLVCAQEEDIEAVRLEMLERWGIEGLAQPKQVELKAQALFAKSLAEQPDVELETLAKQANAAANFVGFILEEYQEYYRDNYKYDFVQKKMAPFHDAYVRLSNKLLHYRNQAYFNLAQKAVQRGDKLKAFFLYRDAFRLSSFSEEDGDHKGIRYQAEIEMKKLLGIEDIGTFLYWK